MKFGIIVICLAALLSAPSYADENSSIGFKTVALAL
ncbi:molecular chaperone DnaJ, partial [Shewanella baltica]|nr:molecular chaperone DnaJ [Shewanella baltica]